MRSTPYELLVLWLLHMIYVLWLVLDGNSSRAVAAI